MHRTKSASRTGLLAGIVPDAAERNESIGQVVDWLQVIGQVGRWLAAKVAELTPADLLRVLASEEGEG